MRVKNVASKNYHPQNLFYCPYTIRLKGFFVKIRLIKRAIKAENQSVEILYFTARSLTWHRGWWRRQMQGETARSSSLSSTQHTILEEGEQPMGPISSHFWSTCSGLTAVLSPLQAESHSVKTIPHHKVGTVNIIPNFTSNEETSPERFTDLPKVTQLVRENTGLQTRQHDFNIPALDC